MAGKYSSYVSVKSGNNDTFRGELPLQGAGASAFSYQKNIVVDVFLSGFGSTIVQRLTGDWEIRLRAGQDPESKVLFHQKVLWTAQVVAMVDPFFGGIAFVTWQPLGDGGSGKQQTFVCNGQECATIEDPSIATEEEWQAYGETGAWRFLDNPAIRPTMTPRQKYDAEKGFTIFTPEGAATVGTYKFFATWQSAIIGYNCRIPAGGVLEVVTDKWQFASLSREATYQFAFKEGAARQQMLFNRDTGETWLFYPDSGDLRCSRTRRIESVPLGDEAVVSEASPTAIVPARRDGRIWVMLGETDSLRICSSTDSGFNWKGEEMITDKVNVVGGAGDSTGSTFYAFGFAQGGAGEGIENGEPVRALVRFSMSGGESTWELERIEKIVHDGKLPFEKTFAGVTQADSVYWVWFVDGKELECWRVTDGFANWIKVEAAE